MKILRESDTRVEYKFNGNTNVTRINEDDEEHIENLIKFNDEFNQFMKSIGSKARGRIAEVYWDFGAKEVWVTQIIDYTDSKGRSGGFQSLTPGEHSMIDRGDYTFVAESLNDYPDTYNLSPEQLANLNETGPAKFGFGGKY